MHRSILQYTTYALLRPLLVGLNLRIGRMVGVGDGSFQISLR